MLKNNVFKMTCYIIAMICITAIVLATDNTALMWWYVLPVLVFGAEITTSDNQDSEGEND